MFLNQQILMLSVGIPLLYSSPTISVVKVASYVSSEKFLMEVNLLEFQSLRKTAHIPSVYNTIQHPPAVSTGYSSLTKAKSTMLSALNCSNTNPLFVGLIVMELSIRCGLSPLFEKHNSFLITGGSIYSSYIPAPSSSMICPWYEPKDW